VLGNAAAFRLIAETKHEGTASPYKDSFLGNTENYVEYDKTSQSPKKRNGWRLFLWIVLASLIILLVVGEVMLRRATPILKGRVIETLSTRFNSHVELDGLQVSLTKGIAVSGNGLRIFAPDDVVAAGAKDPIIAVQRFDFHARLIGLFLKPTHVGSVHVQGLAINIPPKSMRHTGKPSQHRGKIKILVDEFVCDDSRLVIGTDKPDRDPKVFVLQHIVLKDVGPNAPMHYDATLINAIPKGDIHAIGTFGPWDTEAPGESTVTGRYTFQHAELNTIKGIGGTLESTGDFTGRLDRIEVQGIADVPDFSLDTANHPVPLHTQFSAIVDGTTGDTYLQPVNAKLGASEFSCQGAVVNIKGKGHTIDLDVDVPAGHIQDFLQLAVKTRPTVMTGVLAMKTKLHIRPGKESVTEKLGLKGTFGLKQIHFTNPEVQDKVDMLSLRAEGHPREAKPGSEDVSSRMTGQFLMSRGNLTLHALKYTLPGATVQLQGVYTLDGKKFDFNGKVRTQAKLSQMVASRWKSWALKLADPFFHKHGAGAEIPVKVTGTNTAPKFGLDLGHKDKKSD
jgi:AsmA-like C-terminal region